MFFGNNDENIPPGNRLQCTLNYNGFKVRAYWPVQIGQVIYLLLHGAAGIQGPKQVVKRTS